MTRLTLLIAAMLVFSVLPGLCFGRTDSVPRLHRSFIKQILAARDCADRGEYAKAQAYTSLVTPAEIKVGLDPSSGIAGLTALQSAIIMWNEALNGQTRLILTDQASAQVRISFGGSLVYSGQACMAHAVWTRTLVPLGWGSFEGHLSATIAIRSEINGRPCTPGELKHAAAHELGHVLGLDDSAHPSDVMGPQVGQPCPTEPAHEEIEAIFAAGEDAQAIVALCRNASFEASQPINFGDLIALPVN